MNARRERLRQESMSQVPPKDLSRRVVELLAGPAALLGGGSAREVRSEVAGNDPYYWYYWRFMGWNVALLTLGALGLLLMVIGEAANSAPTSALALTLIGASVGCAVLASLYGARWSAYQRLPRLVTTLPWLFKPRSLEVIAVFVLWLAAVLLTLVPN